MPPGSFIVSRPTDYHKERRVVSITFDGLTQEVLPLRDFTVSDAESEFSPGPIATSENSELDLDLV